MNGSIEVIQAVEFPWPVSHNDMTVLFLQAGASITV